MILALQSDPGQVAAPPWSQGSYLCVPSKVPKPALLIHEPVKFCNEGEAVHWPTPCLSEPIHPQALMIPQPGPCSVPGMEDIAVGPHCCQMLTVFQGSRDRTWC